MPKFNKSQVSVLSLAILALVIAVLTNIATNQLPENVKPYLWYAWPALVILAVVFVVITLLSHKSSPSGPEPEFSLKRYYEALRKRYQILDLDALTPPLN